MSDNRSRTLFLDVLGREPHFQGGELHRWCGTRCNRPDVGSSKRAVLILEHPLKRQLPEDVVVAPAGFTRQGEDP